MNLPRLAVAMGYLSEDLLAGAINYMPKVHHRYKWFMAFAACICLLIGGLFVHQQIFAPPEVGEISISEHGVSIPKRVVDLSGNTGNNMLRFFIFNDRCYVEYDLIDGDTLQGEYLGTATGYINSWTPKYEYKDLHGSVAGEFYSVIGYDPSFMLCIKEDDNLRLYINNNGITLKEGTELFEDRLKMSTNAGIVYYQSSADWKADKDNIQHLGLSSDRAINLFIESLRDAKFIRTSDIPVDEEGKSIYDCMEIYHLFFEMNDGIRIHLRVFEGGYVLFEGLSDVSVRVDVGCIGKMMEGTLKE